MNPNRRGFGFGFGLRATLRNPRRQDQGTWLGSYRAMQPEIKPIGSRSGSIETGSKNTAFDPIPCNQAIET
jgi:hypothetical protein